MGKITIYRGDIVLETADVIVNAANRTLRGGGGVDGAIHRAAGPSLPEECIKIGGCQTGDAVMTNAGLLKAKKIIHTVGPVWQQGNRGQAVLLRDCYHKSLTLAKTHGLKSIAFPAISTGAYRYPVDDAATIAIDEGIKFLNDFEEIRYVCFSAEDLKVYQGIYTRLMSHKNGKEAEECRN